MKAEQLKQQLAQAQATVRLLQEELAETNHGLMALTLELEERVEERTAELRAAHAELKTTNTELLQMTMELEDRVAQRTAELCLANESLRSEMAERECAQEALLRSEIRYRSLFENMLEGLAYCRMIFEDGQPRDFVYLEVNRAFEKLTGLKGVVGKKVTEVIPDIRQSHAELFEIFGQVVTTGQPARLELYFAPLAAWLTIAVYRSDEGCFTAVFDDITERKLFEMRLRELIIVIQNLAKSRDLDAIMASVRTAARHLTGADGATFVLRDGAQCHYADEDAISPLWKGQRFPMSACVSGWVMTHRQPAVIPDIYADPRVPVEAYRPTFVKSMAMVPIPGIPGAEALGAIGNYWARHYHPSPAELELLQTLAEATAISLDNVHLYREMEQRVAARTVQLEAANKELEAFSYSVSHDLRAPLRAIDGFARILVEDNTERLDAEGRRVLDVICHEARRMGELIDDLLSFSRMARQAMQAAIINMAAQAEEAFQEQRAHAPGRTVELKMGALPPGRGDPAMLRLVWGNLLSNAVKYTKGKNPAIIEIGASTTGAEPVYFVKDNGAGFDPRYINKLFGVFQRLHGAAEFEGTGVGLAMVQRIIHRHGGRVWAEGKVGEGACFYFTLPGS